METSGTPVCKWYDITSGIITRFLMFYFFVFIYLKNRTIDRARDIVIFYVLVQTSPNNSRAGPGRSQEPGSPSRVSTLLAEGAGLEMEQPDLKLVSV